MNRMWQRGLRLLSILGLGKKSGPGYEDTLETLYRTMPLEGMSVVDVGAHCGRHTIPLAEQAGSGTVFAFEPLPSIRKKLVRKCCNKGLQNVVVLPFALSAESAELDFHYARNCPEESGLRRQAVYTFKNVRFDVIRVRAKPLDKVIPPEEKIGFIKIDVEGAELNVLAGALDTIRRNQPVVAFECGAVSYSGYDNNAALKIWDFFSSLEYSVYAITGLRMSSADEFNAASQEQVFWDYIAVPDSRREEAEAWFLQACN